MTSPLTTRSAPIMASDRQHAVAIRAKELVGKSAKTAGEAAPFCFACGKKRKAQSRQLGPLSYSRQGILFELGRDARKRAVELCTKAVDDGDDRNRDARGNQAVFDCRGAAIVIHETQN